MKCNYLDTLALKNNLIKKKKSKLNVYYSKNFTSELLSTKLLNIVY